MGVFNKTSSHCDSFVTRSARAVFSVIFSLYTVSEMTPKLKSVFVIQQTSNSVCRSCKKTRTKETSIFVLKIHAYVTSFNLTENTF